MLFASAARALPPSAWQSQPSQDYEYELLGVANPVDDVRSRCGGWRHVTVQRATQLGGSLPSACASWWRWPYPQVTKIRLVQDNLTRHDGLSTV